MISIGESENYLYLGIDGGGSKCRAVISTGAGNIIGQGIGGPANPLHGLQKTFESILDATSQALVNAGCKPTDFSQLIAGVGLAGVNLPGLYQQVSQWQHPFNKMYLTTDLDIANIGAHNGFEGAVIIVGTGSCGFVKREDKQTILGGHGFPIGDKASGAWMGLEAVKHSLLVRDGFHEQSLLADRVCQYFSTNTALELSENIAGRSSRQFAQLASLVFECADQGDCSAQKIVNAGLEYIIQMANKLLREHPVRLCMIGGLSRFIMPRLPQTLSRRFVEPLNQPEIGAVHYALQHHQGLEKCSVQVS